MTGRKYRSLESAYWSNVIKGDTGCWTWAGKSPHIPYESKVYPLARTAYQIHNHVQPTALEVVRHKCLHKFCTKPAHLELGSYTDNNVLDKRRDKPILDSLYSPKSPRKAGGAE